MITWCWRRFFRPENAARTVNTNTDWFICQVSSGIIGIKLEARFLDTLTSNRYNISCAEVAQVVEQRTENPRVVSSTLTLGTISLTGRKWLSGRASPCQGESREFEPRLPLHTSTGRSGGMVDAADSKTVGG